jgi:hypothetical protein
VTAAQRRGQIDGRWPADVVSTHLLALVEGMFVLGRTARDPERMRDVIELTLQSPLPAGAAAR